MEDSFRVRVDKVFGALGSGGTPSSVGVTPALWSLTDEEIQRRQWNRSKEVPEKCEDRHQSTQFPLLQPDLETDLNELSDKEEEEVEEEEEEEGEEIDGAKRRRNNSGGGGESSVDEYLDVRSNIGRDCTLDFEEEEDEYDKVAVGAREYDRIYMRNVELADYQIDDVTDFSELPSSLKVAEKDPRANHSGAKLRLREDAEAAGELDALQLSESSMATNLDAEDNKKGKIDIDDPKPILKKRDNSMDSKTLKRVRFMVDPESSTHVDQQTSGASDLTPEPHARGDDSMSEQTSDLSEYSTSVPDYVRNPSKYTHYTFDSTDEMDEAANQKAYVDFFHDLRKGYTDTLMEETPVELPKSIVFTPKKKPENDSTTKAGSSDIKTRENLENKHRSVDITANDIQESEVSAMEEDELDPAIDEVGHGSRKSGRQYRTKTNVDDGDHNSDQV